MDAGGAGNVEKIRAILFGAQMRDYEKKFSLLEDRMQKEINNLRSETAKRFDALETYINKELFGYEKGAFTSATRSRAGLIEEAQGGSVFLDEIGELTPNLQAKLLSVLESKTLRRLGSNKSIKVDVRVIAATNRDLQQEVRDKRFREDLFYRLNVVSITMPPLRSMGEDVLVITGHLIKVFNVEFNKKVLGLSKTAHQKGNVAPR